MWSLFLIVFIAGLIWLSRQAPRHKSKTGAVITPAGSIDGPGEYDFDIVGESFYQDNLTAIAGPKSREMKRVFIPAIIIPYTTNEHDPQAVRVEIKGLTVGHLAKSAAASYRKKLSIKAPSLPPMACDALIVGGWIDKDGKEAHYGVKLDIPTE